MATRRGVKMVESDHFHGSHHPTAPQCEDGSPARCYCDTETIAEDLKKVENGLVAEDPGVQLEAARKLRQLLSSQRDFLIREVLNRNWVPRLLGWLRLSDRPTLQVEALWALTNIAAGTTEHTHVLLKHGVVPTLVSLLESTNDEVLEQAVWVLGNIAGDGPSPRDAVLNAGILVPLVKCLNGNPRLSLLRIGTWTLTNLCDGQPRPVFDIGYILPTLAQRLEETDTEVLSHVCWALSHLCDGPSSHIQMVVNADVCWRLVELLMHRSWRVTKPALRTIGNIVCAEDDHDYTQHIIDCGAVPCLRQLIAHSNREIQKEACWTLSNIAAGTVDQIQCVLDSGSILPLVQLASEEVTDPEVKSEACWVILNATSCGSDVQIEYLVRHGCVEVLGRLLAETSMVMMALEGLERILQVGEEEAKRSRGTNPYAHLLASTRIEELETHKSAAVAKRASRIWKQHFVTCAICGLAFSKHSPETFFCEECKCNVCTSCNCSVFHLEYQESFWKGETEKETVRQEAKQQSKRNKRAKKRKKTKEKKALLRQQKDGSFSGTPGSGSGGGGGASPAVGSGEADDCSGRDSSNRDSNCSKSAADGGGVGGRERSSTQTNDSCSSPESSPDYDRESLERASEGAGGRKQQQGTASGEKSGDRRGTQMMENGQVSKNKDKSGGGSRGSGAAEGPEGEGLAARMGGLKINVGEAASGNGSANGSGSRAGGSGSDAGARRQNDDWLSSGSEAAVSETMLSAGMVGKGRGRKARARVDRSSEGQKKMYNTFKDGEEGDRTMGAGSAATNSLSRARGAHGGNGLHPLSHGHPTQASSKSNGKPDHAMLNSGDERSASENVDLNSPTAAESGSKAAGRKVGDKEKEKDSSLSAFSHDKSDLVGNDELVSYLEATGSILALASRLDEEEMEGRF